MKGSTLRRSNLTREKIAMLESLAKYNEEMKNSGLDASSEKQEELDFLWRNFKVAAKAEKSPIAFFTTGVFVGVIATLIVAIFISYGIGYSPLNEINISKPVKAPKENLKFTFIPADKQTSEDVVTPANSETETVKPQAQATGGKLYMVQSGDSLESIAIRFYGGFDQTKLKKIENANGMTNPNEIKIGQKLTIPMN